MAGRGEPGDERVERLVPPAASGGEQSFGELRHYVPAEILNVRFPASVRGYDRGAVDSYVKRVNRVIAELKVSASPPAAVRHALEQAGQQVHGLLQSARETAEGITAGARQEAEETTARAKAEAAELVVSASAEADRARGEAEELLARARTEVQATAAEARAEADEIRAAAAAESETVAARTRAEADERLRQLQDELAALRDQGEKQLSELRADSEALWGERRALLDDVRRLASSLVELADSAAGRFPRLEPPRPDAQPLQHEPGDETDSRALATGQPARTSVATGSALASDDGGDKQPPPPVSSGG